MSATTSGAGEMETDTYIKTVTTITTTTETEVIITITTDMDTAAEVDTTAVVAAVRDRPEEVGAVVTQTVTDADKAARSLRDATAGPTGMDPTQAQHATAVLMDTRQTPPLQA